MNLIVLGSTRGTGYQVVMQALQAGHTVTAVARRPQALAIKHENLKIVAGDVCELATFAGAMAGQDAVVSAIGADSNKPTTLYSVGIANSIQAMQSNSVKRLICVSASGLETGAGQPWWQRFLIRVFLQPLLKEPYADMVRMERQVQASQLDWTIVRPPRLTNGPHRKHYQVALNSHLSGLGVSRSDVADYIVNHLNDTTTYSAKVELAY